MLRLPLPCSYIEREREREISGSVSVLEHTCYLHTCLWKLGNVFQVERQLKATFVCTYNKKKAGAEEEEEVEENVYKEKKNVHENFTDYVFAETEREREREAGKVSGKWANTGLLGALDARLDDSAPALSQSQSQSQR